MFKRPSLESFRRRLASVDALPQLCVLGVLSGVLTGGLMVGFRGLLELGALAFMPGGDPEAFERLAGPVRVVLPLMAVGLIGVWLWRMPNGAGKIGIGHVIERLTYHQGKMPLRNWMTQWWVGLVALLGGLSAGREGPAIHLGAAASSWIGQTMRLPHNSLRVLVGCGTAAGIAASFNTPIAGVIFAMEVVMMEYTITGFMPVILASTTGAVVSQLAYGSQPAFSVPSVQLASLFDLPWIAVTALLIGLVAGAFVRLAKPATWQTRWPVWGRFLAVGLAVGAVAWWYPQVQGMGYDSLERMLVGEPALDVLIVVALGKLALTALAIAFGVPVSIIGPILVAGAAFGTLCGLLWATLLPGLASSPVVFSLLGMAAMMGAVLQAPLAALMALLELTHNSSILLPGMLAVVIAVLVSRQGYHCSGFFISTLDSQGLHPLQRPLMQALSRVAVPAVMERSVARAPRILTRAQAQELLAGKPTWLVITREDGKPPVGLKAAGLARLMLDEQWQDETRFDLLEIPGQRVDMAPIALQATLSEAFEQLNKQGVDVLYVEHTTAPLIRKISGIITRDAIENYYRYK
ncbi:MULTISPECIES: chloride channel protein [Chromohalobacter]|uniref:chloride channel protein n=1 Tax=Chromohalobacter TaxID=42054 RepID=UPI00054F099B|nr:MULTISPECIES: chloride channel protein [Chromohalobacter]MDF9433895.1 chloride channel protein [Chromohalobacter israelensis]NQY45623.1 chloride channel protein [Chromohalobacter sp.]